MGGASDAKICFSFFRALTFDETLNGIYVFSEKNVIVIKKKNE